mmetsp:Transcript_53303/g.125262  ORF Transcript_53303/g.125262 Transcript_53303/m.125262 type:complete len:251 (+) Transcript_53303:2683-3435(+)
MTATASARPAGAALAASASRAALAATKPFAPSMNSWNFSCWTPRISPMMVSSRAWACAERASARSSVTSRRQSRMRLISPAPLVITDQFRSRIFFCPLASVFSISAGSRWALNSKFISSSPRQAARAASTCDKASALRPLPANTSSMTGRWAMSSVSRMVLRCSENSGCTRPPGSMVRMPCGMPCNMAWISAVFWRTCSLLCWIFSIIALKAITDLPISSSRRTGRRCEKSWLAAISVILACISPMGRTI